MKKLTTVLPRVRSNSTASPRLYTTSSLSLFDSSAPPPARPVLSSTRLSVEGKPPAEGENAHSHPPFSLALPQPLSSSTQPLAHSYPQAHFYSSALVRPLDPHTLPSPPTAHTHPRPKRQKLRYQLDVGAYGIPKRGRARRHHYCSNDPSLAVQVGEDAYFIRDNAMGVADGVGGWPKSHLRLPSSPSALFARRLMHYCSAEIDSASHKPPTSSTAQPPSRSCFSFTHHLRPRPWNSLPTFNNSLPQYSLFLDNNHDHRTALDLEQDLEDSLEELSEGLDVLQILERAYDKTLKAHVVPDSSPTTINTATTTTPPPPQPPPLPNTVHSCPSSESKPLLAGSSTALLAVLDHPPRTSTTTSTSPGNTTTSHNSENSATKTSTAQSPFYASTASATAPLSSSISDSGSGSHPGTPPLECRLEDITEGEAKKDIGEYDAVIKIAHVGDCMGMLVRGEEIAWRSEEMWWDFNTPVQLGPTTQSVVTPRACAMVVQVPVKEGDILILATDGLSDNLWDEDVLDEVVRFKRRGFLDGVKDDIVEGVDEQGVSVGGENVFDSGYSSSSSSSSPETPTATGGLGNLTVGGLKRKTVAGMLSEALCSRAKRVSEQRPSPFTLSPSSAPSSSAVEDLEVPFTRRAREAGKKFSSSSSTRGIGGKRDDISVVVAVISRRA